MSFMPADRVSSVPKQLHPAPASQHQPWDSCSLGQDSEMLSNPNEPGLHRYPRSTLNLKQGISKKADWQLSFSQSRVLLREWEKCKNLHHSTSTSKLHVKPAVSASSRQIALTCKPVPKSCTKPVLNPPQTHQIPVARTYAWLTQGSPHPAHAGYQATQDSGDHTQEPASTEAQTMTNGILRPYLFQAKAVGRMHILYVSGQTKY